jgi:OmpA-OmpF porin, OOP family
LQGVQFEKNKVELLPTAFYDLDRVSKWLTQNPNVNIEISAHTNAFCSRDFAQTLTDRRAKAIGDYFVNQGISLRRLRILGVGNAQPLSSNATTEGRLRNQRVEIVVVQ